MQRATAASSARSRARYGAASAPGIARPIDSTARSARRGSCHQCGSSPSSPAARPASTTASESTPALSSAPSSHSSVSPPERRTTSAFASAFTSRGRTSYSCGSVLAFSSVVTCAEGATLRAMSASWVVVATTRGPSPPGSPAPQPAANTARMRTARRTDAESLVKLILIFMHGFVQIIARRDVGPMAAMLCWKPLMDVTRRQVLGLGVVALGALRLPSRRVRCDRSGSLRTRPRRLRRARGRRPLAHQQGDRGAAPLRPRRAPLEPRDATFRRRCAPAPPAAAGRPGPRSRPATAPASPAPTRPSPAPPTSCNCACAATPAA